MLIKAVSDPHDKNVVGNALCSSAAREEDFFSRRTNKSESIRLSLCAHQLGNKIEAARNFLPSRGSGF